MKEYILYGKKFRSGTAILITASDRKQVWVHPTTRFVALSCNKDKLLGLVPQPVAWSDRIPAHNRKHYVLNGVRYTFKWLKERNP